MIKRLSVLLLCAVLSAPALAGGYGGRYHYGGYYHHRGGHGDGAALLLGGLVLGGLIGYFVSEDRYYRRSYYPTYRHDYYGRPYYGPVYREYVRVVPAPTRVIVRESPEFAGRNCRMTREYTTTIEIDGENREAYGTKCLTADGSWVLGAPKLAPEFD
jgi:surface antigen